MTFTKIKLTNISVNAYFPPTEPISEALIEGGEGSLTIAVIGTQVVRQILEVQGGKRVNPLRLGQPVRGSGKDPEGKIVYTLVLETVETGELAQFRGPDAAAS